MTESIQADVVSYYPKSSCSALQTAALCPSVWFLILDGCVVTIPRGWLQGVTAPSPHSSTCHVLSFQYNYSSECSCCVVKILLDLKGKSLTKVVLELNS